MEHSKKNIRFKNIILLILIFNLTALSFNTLNSQVFQDGFESGGTSNWLSGQYYSFQNATTSSPAVGNYCLRQTGSSNHFQGLRANFSSNISTYISWYVKVQNTSSPSGYVVIGDSSAFGNGAIWSYISGGYLRFISGGNYYYPVSANTWYKIELRNFNWISKTYDIYINGQLRRSSFSFRVKSNKLNLMHLYNYRTNNTAYWDGIRVEGNTNLNTPPFAVCKNITVQLNENGSATIAPIDIDNGSSDTESSVTLSVSRNIFSCDDVGVPSLVTLTAIDNQGLSDNCTATVTVKDEIAPVAIAQNVEVQLDASGNGSTTAILVNNGSNDACGIASLSLSQTAFDCSHVGDNAVVLTVTDVNGNMSTANATVTVKDEIAPVAIAQNVEVQLDATGNGSTTVALVDIGSNDNCGIASMVLSQTDFDCSEVGANAETLTVTDVNGNVSVANITVTVEDNVLPNALAQDVTVQLDATGNGSTTVALVDTGSNDNCGIASMVLSQTDFDCSEVGANAETLTVTDVNGNVSVANITVTVEDNVLPNALAQDVTVQLDATGNGSTTVALVDTGSNDNCGIASMVLSQTDFDCSEVGANAETLTVTDVNGNVSVANITVTVEDNVLPNALAQDVTVQLDATGNGSTTVALVDTGSNDNCGIASMVLSQTDFDCSEVGANAETLTVTDVNGNVSVANITVTVEDNVLPNALAQDVTVQLDATGNGSTTVALVDTGSNDNCGIASMVLSQTDFDCSEVGANAETLTVTDVNGNVSVANITVTVEDNVLPNALAQDVTVQLDATGNGSTTVALVDTGSNDNCGIASMVLSQTDFDCSEVGANAETLTVTDVNGNVSVANITVTVEDNVLPNALAQDVTVQLDATGNGSTTVALVDTGSNDNCGIASMVLSQTDFDCSEVGANAETLTVTDVNGNVSVANITVTVEDNVLPNALAQDVTVQLDATGNGSTTVALVDTGSNDNCGIASMVLSQTDFDCSEVGANAETLTVTDVNGNVSVANITVTVEDNVLPNALAQDVTVQLDATGNGSTTVALVDTGSNDNCGIASMVLSQTDFDCSNVGENIVTLTVTDVNGNLDSALATITVEDNVDPIITCATNDKRYIDPYQTYYTVTATEFDATATDNCGMSSLTYTGGSPNTSGSTMNGVQLNLGLNTMNWTAIDVNGNESYCTTVVEVIKRPTTLTYSGDLVEQYSDSVDLAATLIDDVSGDGVQGKTISFTIGSQSTTATTDVNGLASTSLILTQDPATNYTVVSEFTEDTSYLGSSDEDSFDITQENSVVNYIGNQLTATTNLTATIDLRVSVQDIDDSYRGDITNATVEFFIDGGSIMGPTPISVLIDPYTGIISKEWTTSIARNSGSEEYTFRVEIDGYYTGEEVVPIIVYEPTGDFITGGGYIIPTASAGLYPSDEGSKTNFGFNVKFNKKGTKLKGKLNFIWRSDGRIYQAKSNATDALGVDVSDEEAMTAVFTSKCNYSDITDPLNPISLGGNKIMHVSMTDRGEPGENDDISFTLWDGNELLYSSNWSGVNSIKQLLNGGNLVVHSGFNLGSDDARVSTSGKSHVESEITELGLFEVTAWRNPSDTFFNLKVVSDSRDEFIEIIVFDINFKLVHKSKFRPQELYKFGQYLEAGAYIVKLTQGDKLQTVRVMKY